MGWIVKMTMGAEWLRNILRKNKRYNMEGMGVVLHIDFSIWKNVYRDNVNLT